MQLALFIISLVFSALISIVYLVQLLSRFSTWASCSCSSSATESMSSANCRQVILLLLMLTFPSCSSRASDMICSIKMLKRVGDRRHLFLTPTVLGGGPVLRWCWVNFQCRSVLQFGLQLGNGLGAGGGCLDLFLSSFSLSLGDGPI